MVRDDFPFAFMFSQYTFTSNYGFDFFFPLQKSEPEYDYVLDEEIDFVQALQMPGTRKDNVSKQ